METHQHICWGEKISVRSFTLDIFNDRFAVHLEKIRRWRNPRPATYRRERGAEISLIVAKACANALYSDR